MTEPSDEKPKSKKADKPPAPIQPRLVLPPDLDAVYANMVRISHTPSEMVMDFSRILPGDTQAQVMSRILMSPLSTKLLQRALTENLAKYEAVYGEINIPVKNTLASQLFRPPQANDEDEDGKA
jgi:hypothetical protein